MITNEQSAGNNAYLYSLSTGWRNWWDLVGQHLCHVCTIQSNHQQQTAGEEKTEEKQTIRNPAVRTDMFNFAMGQRQYAFTCMALLPNFTTSNNIMFSMPFSWWWPFIRPAPFTPLPFSPAPFFPFFPPWNRKTYAVTLPAEHTKYTYNWRFKEIQTLLKKRQVSFTFPFAAFVVLPSGSSEKSVSDENRVSVSLLSTKK